MINRFYLDAWPNVKLVARMREDGITCIGNKTFLENGHDKRYFVFAYKNTPEAILEKEE